jgi:hypothetical protein
MIKFSKLLFTLLLALSLTACIDESVDESTAEALREQNEILREQNKAASVTLFGKVTDLGTDQPVTGATVRVVVAGSEQTSTTTAENGAFELVELPPSSDYELVVQDTNGNFMDRAVFGSTRATSSGTAHQDVGTIGVSEAETVSFYVVDTETQEPVDSLTFYSYSHIGDGSNSDAYRHVSSFNAETGQYQITLPYYIPLGISADVDADKNGAPEWGTSAYSYANTLHISYSDVWNLGTLYLYDLTTPAQELELRVSVLDPDLNAIQSEDILLTVSDADNGQLTASYDELTSQYVLAAEITNELEALLPAFSVGDTHYGSVSLRVSRTSGDQFYVSISNSQNTNSSYLVPDSIGVLDVAIRPRVETPSSSLRVVTRSDEISAPDYLYRVFYSNTINLLPESVTLLQQNAITVTHGNASDADLVLPGTTRIDQIDSPVAIDTSVQLNGTSLTAQPAGALAESYTYIYRVGTLVDAMSDIEVDVFGDDQRSFYPSSTTEFDINALKIDNNNYTTQGSVIVTHNTAGEPSSAYNDSRYVYIVLPTSIETLQNFTLRAVQVTQNGTVRARDNSYQIVQDGNIGWYNPDRTHAVRLAENEQALESISNRLFYGAAVADGLWYSVRTYEYLSDNTSSATNSMSFEYAYETKGGRIETGTITLPVL